MMVALRTMMNHAGQKTASSKSETSEPLRLQGIHSQRAVILGILVISYSEPNTIIITSCTLPVLHLKMPPFSISNLTPEPDGVLTPLQPPLVGVSCQRSLSG
jgi:hypothetical protein